ncbi:aldehyde ferredoxin oxidoreductase, partial [Candidatus Bathyarchaeota archaeon]
MPGFIGRLARVDLSKGKVREEEIEEEVFRKFLGGKGLAAKIILEELDPNVDPFSPENKLIFATGPLTGTAYPGSG